LEDLNPAALAVRDEVRRTSVDGEALRANRRREQRMEVHLALDLAMKLEPRVRLEVDAHDVGPRMRGRVEDGDVEALAARGAPLVAPSRETLEDAPRRLVRELLGGIEARFHLRVDGVLRAAADRVVRLVREKRSPCGAE